MTPQQIIDIVRQKQWVSTDEILQALNATPQELGETFEEALDQGAILSFAGRWTTPDQYELLKEACLKAISELHELEPESIFQPVLIIAEKAGIDWNGKPLDRLFQRMIGEGLLFGDIKGVRLPDFKPKISDKQETLLERVETELEKTPINTPYPSDVANSLGIPENAVRTILQLGIAIGRVIELESGVFLTSRQTKGLENDLRKWAGNRPFEKRDVRDYLQTTRRYAGPLLEYFDSVGITQRVEDGRVFL